MFKFQRACQIALAVLLAASVPASTEVDADVKTLLDIADAIGKAWSMDDSKYPEFLQIVKSRAEKLDSVKAIYQKYKPDIDKKSETGKLVMQKIGWTCSQFDLFNSYAEDFEKNFKKNTDRRFEYYDMHMKHATEMKAWGLCQMALKQLDENDQLATTLKALKGDDSTEAAAAMERIPALRKAAESKMAAIKKATERVVKMPVETYTGADKEKYRAAIKKAWLAAWPKDKILKIVFSSGWRRDDEWNHNGNGNWSHSDMSFLVPWVIVQTDATTAMMYPAYVNKNNLSGSITYGVQTKGGSYVNDQIPLSKVK